MKKELKIEDFSASLLWDVDKSQLDFEKNAMHVVEKALNRGTWEDFKTVLNEMRCYNWRQSNPSHWDY